MFKLKQVKEKNYPKSFIRNVVSYANETNTISLYSYEMTQEQIELYLTKAKINNVLKQEMLSEEYIEMIDNDQRKDMLIPFITLIRVQDTINQNDSYAIANLHSENLYKTACSLIDNKPQNFIDDPLSTTNHVLNTSSLKLKDKKGNINKEFMLFDDSFHLPEDKYSKGIFRDNDTIYLSRPEEAISIMLNSKGNLEYKGNKLSKRKLEKELCKNLNNKPSSVLFSMFENSKKDLTFFR